MATENRARADAPWPVEGGHHHRDVSGGWLRPAVFGAMDGLVTNVSLIAGVGGGGGSQHAILLTGPAGLRAVAFAIGAIIPLLPYALGFDALWVALLLSAVAAVVGGGVVSRLTDRPFWR